jgi:hypothetical protein
MDYIWNLHRQHLGFLFFTWIIYGGYIDSIFGHHLIEYMVVCIHTTIEYMVVCIHTTIEYMVV